MDIHQEIQEPSGAFVCVLLTVPAGKAIYERAFTCLRPLPWTAPLSFRVHHLVFCDCDGTVGLSSIKVPKQVTFRALGLVLRVLDSVLKQVCPNLRKSGIQNHQLTK